MNILAIDPGTRTGWASLTKGRVESGVQSFELGRGDSPGMRYLRFNVWLPTMLNLVEPRIVIYERPLLRFGYSAEVMAGFTTRIQETCAREKIDCEAVAGATLKKFACGKGNADKAAMVRAANTLWKILGRSIVDDNEADALSLLAFAVRTYVKEGS